MFSDKSKNFKQFKEMVENALKHRVKVISESKEFKEAVEHNLVLEFQDHPDQRIPDWTPAELESMLSLANVVDNVDIDHIIDVDFDFEAEMDELDSDGYDYEDMMDEIDDEDDLDEELSEGVKVKNDRYVRTHGKNPSGSGYGKYMFTSKAMGDPKDSETFSASGSKKDAVEAAKKWAEKNGVSTIYMMEAKKMDPEDDPCWDGYEMVGKKKKDGKEVPNCVKKEDLDEAYDDPREAGKKGIYMTSPQSKIGKGSDVDFYNKNGEKDYGIVTRYDGKTISIKSSGDKKIHKFDVRVAR